MSLSFHAIDNPSGLEHFSILQVSDLHLDNKASALLAFDKVLDDTRSKAIDLIVVSGDLVHTIDSHIYEKIFSRLDGLQIPYVCIAGNHDVTQELDPHLSFEQRRHVPMSAHPRLVGKHSVMTPHWQLLFCDSTVAGKVYGHFSDATLTWLAEQLSTAQKPCVLFCHHHILPVHSAWLDGHITTNYAEFWQVIAQFPHKLTAIFTGHVHQEQNQVYQGVAVYTVPSLSEQFLPFSDTFAMDNKAQPGYRWITLYNNGKLATAVKRIDTSTPQ